MAMGKNKFNMSPREKIIQARIALLRLYPFFGTMAMHLRPIELEEKEANKLMPNPGGGEATIGVDKYGNMPYNKAFVKKLTSEELLFIIAHETMHIALQHLDRKGSRNPKLWNIATDEAINNMLKHEMRVWKGGLCSHQFEEKSAEEIYDELLKKTTIEKVYGGSCPNSFDTHFYGGGNSKNSKKGNSPFYTPGQEKIDAPKMIKDAASFAKGQGKMPAGMERLFKDLLNPKMNWKEILQKYIISVIPQDFTYTKPSKRAYAAGFYMPSVVKETVDIIIGVDSSGSISDAEYSQFLSEIFAMTRAVQNLRATILICDAEISQVVEIDNNFNPEMDIEGRGYGGTSCRPVFQWIKEEKNENVKLLIYLTDGYIDEPDETIYESGYPVLWVVTPRGSINFLKANIGNQTVVQMEGEIDGDGRW